MVLIGEGQKTQHLRINLMTFYQWTWLRLGDLWNRAGGDAIDFSLSRQFQISLFVADIHDFGVQRDTVTSCAAEVAAVLIRVRFEAQMIFSYAVVATKWTGCLDLSAPKRPRIEDKSTPSGSVHNGDFVIGACQPVRLLYAAFIPSATKMGLIGATTRAGQLSSPLRDRFGVSLRLELYTTEELTKIINRSAALLDMEIDPKGATEIASRSRGTPRIANRMLRRVRDFAQVRYDGVITQEVADHALAQLEIDELGLDSIDRRMLTAIINNYGGGPVGLDTLGATIGEETITLEDVYEPYLMQIGFLTRTPRGRCVTQLAYEHLHLHNPNQQSTTI